MNRSKAYYFWRGVARFVTYSVIATFWLAVFYGFALGLWSLQFSW